MGKRKNKEKNIILTHDEYKEMLLFYGINKKIYKKDKKIEDNTIQKGE